jgi:geranylgeranyl diphosphate synthase type II
MALAANVIDIRNWRKPIRRESIPPVAPDAMMARLQSAFRQRMTIPRQLEPALAAALDHILRHAGSMVRPRIVYRLAHAFPLPEEAALDLAIALEYFHTASLIFDDLPCMDNAVMRRGAPCVHVAFGEAVAILAALALINRAYALAWRAIASCPRGFRKPAEEYLEKHLGVLGLLNGQSLDLNYSRLPHTLDSTERVARGKTVSLISLTLVLPALAGGASSRELQLLDRVSTFWGLSYQIVDDLKDVLESPSNAGKTAGRDEFLDRPNTALAIGVPAAIERLTRLLRAGDRSLDALIALRPALAFLREFRGTLQDELDRVIESTGSVAVEVSR